MKKIILSVLFISLFVAKGICANSPKVVNKVLAVVGKETILMSEYNKITGPIIEQLKANNPELSDPARLKQLKENFLQQMVDEKLILQEAKKQQIRPAKRKVDDAIKEIKSQYSNDEDFKKDLKAQSMTEQEFNKKIEEQVMMMELIDKEVTAKIPEITDDEIQKYFNENKDKDKRLTVPEKVRIRHILVKVPENATQSDWDNALKKIKDLQKKIKAGADFADLAMKNSDDTGSAKNGGDLGSFARGVMVKEFENAAFALNVGQVSEPVKTQFGYHILKCEEKSMAQKLTLDQSKDYIKKVLFDTKGREKYLAWVDGLRKKTNVKINPIE
jgi:parvulin-like peptidyl-prolyl isomerase